MARRKGVGNKSSSSSPARASSRSRAGLSQRPKKRKNAKSGITEVGAAKVKKLSKKSDTVSSKQPGSADGIDWQLGKSVTESISIAQNCDAWSDISFRCADQDEKVEPIKAHKFILASRSPVFEAMLFGLMKETRDEIQLEDVSAETFRNFLRYLYTDDVDLNYKIAEDLVLVAHKYRVTKCIDLCSNFLAENINDDNACRYLQLAVHLGLQDLEAAAMKRIREVTLLILQSQDFLDINFQTLVTILKDNKLNVSSEVVIFKYADKWAAKKCKEQKKQPTGENKRAVLSVAFPLIRFRAMEVGEFVRTTLQKGYFSLAEYEEILADITGVKKMKSPKYDGRHRGNKIDLDFPESFFKEMDSSFVEDMKKLFSASLCDK